MRLTLVELQFDAPIALVGRFGLPRVQGLEFAEAGGSPSRFSTYRDPELQARFPHYEVFAEALQYADPDWRPIIPEWGELNAPNFGVAISEAVTGVQEPREALDNLVPRVREIMENAGYYTWAGN